MNDRIDTLICEMCRHPRSEHLAPDGHRVYWRCQHWIGHPWDGECECHEARPVWVSA